jgi:tRNA nucleotidyltransferase (CCA-adding enzyme)
MDHLIQQLKTFFPETLHPRILLVGGMVRDILLGVPCQDVDLAAAVSPSELNRLGFRLVESKSTPNIFFLFHNELGKIEITRIDSMEDLPDDLRRRDYTINAMAMSLDDATLTDPLGGREDLEQRRLKSCGADSLTDDPVRIFRGLRFECEGWRFDAAAEQMIRSRDWEPDFSVIPVERFSQEMLKALAKDDPSRFFYRMVELNVGRSYLPEIFRMPEVPAGPLEHHPEGDLLTHAMESLQRMSQQSTDIKARFCALFHDLGKLYTPQDQYPKHHAHDYLGAKAAADFCRRLRLPAALQRALQATNRLHQKANKWSELRDSTAIQLALDAMKGGIDQILPLVVASDCKGTMPGWEETLEVAKLNAAQLGIDPSLFSDPNFPPEKCQQLIMQRRVEALRRVKSLRED